MSTWISKRLSWRLMAIAVASMLGLSSAGQAAVHPADRPAEGYTAQKKPRVTVMQFDDTNTDATSQRYGPSVSAMMVTFLKTQSQFVVVERRDLDQVLEEWKQASNGATNEVLDASRVELLEKVDVILHGKVTLIGNNHVEVDAKLLSRFDGRIITAAKHYGPVACLRQLVERLGSEIERSYLKPYYGKLEVNFKEPTSTHIYLTAVLTNQALDEEKPPVELGRTIYPGSEQDTLQGWVTSPTTYTIENVLSGWYTLRLSRPGYRDIVTDYTLWQARNVKGSTRIFYYCAAEKTYLPADSSASERCQNHDRNEGGSRWLDFLVYVPSLRTAELDLTARGFEMVKQGGTIDLEVVDDDSNPLTQFRVLVKSLDLDINPQSPDLADGTLGGDGQSSGLEASRDQPGGVKTETSTPLAETAVNIGKVMSIVETSNKGQDTPEECRFLVDEPVHYIEQKKRIVRSSDVFTIDNYAGGELAFEDYRGEVVPTGRYEVVVWAPYYQIRDFKFDVKMGAKDTTRINVARRREQVLLRGWSENLVTFTGETTGLRRNIELRPESGLLPISLPLDRYQVGADVVGLQPWRRDLNLLPAEERPPGLEVFEDPQPPGDPTNVHRPNELRIKDRVWVAGRVGGFQRSLSAFYDDRVAELLDEIFGDPKTYEWRADDMLDPRLMAELTEHLEDVDLLILNEADMFRMRVIPELETLIGGYVGSGHALMAFVAAGGDYDPLLGAHLTVKKGYGKTSRFKLFPGELRDIRPHYKIELDKKRPMPKLKGAKEARREWRVVSFGKKKKRPRVVERGNAEQGGYTLVWLDSADLVVEPEPDDRPGFFSRLAGAFKKQVAEATIAALLPPDPTIPQEVDPLPEAAKPRSSATPELQLRFSLEAIYKARLANQEILVARSEIKNHALLWAEYLMDRRLGAGEERLREARNRLQGTGVAPSH